MLSNIQQFIVETYLSLDSQKSLKCKYAYLVLKDR